MDVSDELNNFQFWLSGEQFPGTDEDKLRQLAQVHRDAAAAIVKVLPLFAEAIGEIDAAVEGASNAAVVDALREYTSDPGYVDLSARYVRRLGDGMDGAATEVEYVKLMIVATLIELMLEFLIAMAIAFIFPGAMSALATRFLIGRFKIWAWLARAIVAVVLSQVAGVGMQVLMDLVVQAIQIREGHRKSIDWDKIRTSAAVGSLGGAIGVVLGGAGGALGNVFKKLLGKDGLPTDFPGPPPGRPAAVPAQGIKGGPGPVPARIPTFVREYAGQATHAVGTETLTEITWATSHGQSIDWSHGGSIHGAALSGLMSHSVGFAGDRLGHAMRRDVDKISTGRGPETRSGEATAPPKRPDVHGQILRELTNSTLTPSPRRSDSIDPAVVSRTQEGQWLADGVPLLVLPAPDGRPGLTLLSDTDLAAIAGRAVLPSSGGPVLMVHGVPGDGPPAVEVPLQGGGTARLTPEHVARLLGPLPGRPTITLLACYDGDVSADFARRLSTATGSDVLAPDGQVRVGVESQPAQPVSVDDQSWQLFTAEGGEAWDVVNDERPFEGILAVDAAHDRSGLTLATPTLGAYAARPDLLYEVAGAADLDGLVTSVTEAARAEVQARVKPHLAFLTPGGQNAVSVDTSGIENALRNDLPSFFVSGGRTFDVKDGWGRWHTVAVNPTRLSGTETSASLPGTRYDTRIDATTAMRETHTSGESLAVGGGVTLGGRFGPGGAFYGEAALAQATETTESSTTVFDSHNVRSGKTVDIVRSPVRFAVSSGRSDRSTDFTADVGFHALQDIATATPRVESRTGAFDVATLVENTSPVRILNARLDPAATISWNEAAEHILDRLRTTGVADPGSIGREQVRSLLTEANVLGQLMPALESPVHSPLILSPSRRQAVGLAMTAEVTGLRTVADVATSSFRWQPGITETGKQQHVSHVGGGGSVVPIRWGFGLAWVQARFAAGFRRHTATSARQTSTTRTGTEFKDVPNTLTELTVKVTIDPAVRLNALRHPMAGRSGLEPIEVELTVLSRLPRDRVRDLLVPAAEPAPAADPPPRPAPPLAEHGGHAMPLGMSRFRRLLPDTEKLVRRIGGGMLPRFRTEGVAKRMGLARSAAERQRNLAELDRVLSVPSLRQNYTALLNGGVTAVLTRTGVFSDRHTVVHVRARHPDQFRYKGQQPGVAVRNFQSSGEQDEISAGGQWRAAVAGEAAFLGRFPGRVVNTGLTAGGGVEANRRWGLDGSVETTGQESALHGGTPDSEVYEGDLELGVTVYSYRTGLGWDRGSRLGVGRTVKGRDVPAGPRPPAPGFHRDDTTVRGHAVPRYRLIDRRPVRVLYARSAVPQDVSDAHPVSVEDRESSPLERRTPTDPGLLRDYVDRPAGGPGVSEWQYVESMPGAGTAIDLVRRAVQDTQNYGIRKSHRQLGGLRGDDALAEGMPVWARLNDRLTVGRQTANLAAMTEAWWRPETLTTMDDGGRLDVTLAARVTNPRIITARAETTGENAPGGGTQVAGSKTRERHFLARVAVGFGLRKPGTDRDRYGGGATGQAGYQRLFGYRLERGRDKVGGFTERNVNNRKGKARTYLVVADLRLTAGAEVATPARFPKSMVPGPLQPGGWEHHKTVRHSAVVRNGVYLRLTEAQAVKAGLLTTHDDGQHVPHGPRPRPAFTEQVRRSGLRLPPRRSPGQGLQAFRQVPSLIQPATEALQQAIAADPRRRPLLQPVLDALTGRGLADPMLNRNRLRQLLSRAGVRRSWGNLFDGGVSLIHAETGKVTQRLYDVRLQARLTEELVFDGFQADHDDVDLRVIGTRGSGRLVRSARGSQAFAGAAGTGVINTDGKQAAIGAGHQYATTHQTGHTSKIETEHRTNNISSARGVKARIVLRPTFELTVCHRGRAVPDGTVTFQQNVTVDRWAGDLRTAAARRDPAALNSPGAYRPRAAAGDVPGWTSRHGLLVPPRFTPEDIGPATSVQQMATEMLARASRRLREAGYPASHQVRAGLSPDVLLPNAAQLLSAEMLELPGVPATDVLMRKLLPRVGLVPVAARLAGLDSGVYREHLTQNTTSAGTALNQQNVISQTPRLLLGRGYMGDPYQALETTGTGPASGDTAAVASGEDTGATTFGNLKPENPSVLIEYVTRPVLSGKLTGHASGSDPVADDAGRQVTLIVRTGLDEARRILGLGHGAPAAAVSAFDALVAAEKDLKAKADAFVDAADTEAAARYQARGSDAPEVRRDWEAKVVEKDRCEDVFWTALQQHLRNLDEYQATYVAVSDEVPAPAERPAAHDLEAPAVQ